MIRKSEECKIEYREHMRDGKGTVEITNFITGDQELNDETWQVCVETVEQKGIQELIDIWQKYVK